LDPVLGDRAAGSGAPAGDGYRPDQLGAPLGPGLPGWGVCGPHPPPAGGACGRSLGGDPPGGVPDCPALDPCGAGRAHPRLPPPGALVRAGVGGGAGRAPTCARKPAGTPPPAPAVLEGLTQPWGQRQGRRPPPRVSTRFFSFLDPIPPRTFATTCGDVPPHFQPTSRPLPPPFPTIEGDGSVSHRAHRRW